MRLDSLCTPLVAILWAASCALDPGGTAANSAPTSTGTGGATTSSMNVGGGGTTSTAEGGAGGVGGDGGVGGTGGTPCMPTAQNCATATDETCESGGTCAGTLAWKATFGSTSGDEAQSVAVDLDGNILVAGRFQNAIDDGGITLSYQGGYDLFVVKLDPDGMPIWTRAFGDGSTQDEIRVAVDSMGNVLLTGRFEGDIAFDDITLTSEGNGDIFVAKLDPSGARIWARRFGSGGTDSGKGVAADSGGNVLVTGFYGGTTVFDGMSLNNAGGEDVFVAKLDPDGTTLWARGAGDGDGVQHGNAIAVNAAGEVAVTGAFRGALNFGPAPLVEQSGSEAMFVVKLAASGAHQWSTAFGGPNLIDQDGHSLTFDLQGNLIVGSDFQGTTIVDGVDITSADNDNDILLTAFDPGGGILWNQRFGGPGLDTARGVAVDVHGQLAVTGPMGGAMDLGDGPLPFGGFLDVFVTKLGPAGAVHHWSHSYGNENLQLGASVALDQLGSVVIAGVFEGTLDGATSNGAGDVFVMKFAP